MRQDQELKKFIEDLLKNRLSEVEIKKSMKNLGVKYSENPTTRWKLLLEKLGTEEQQETLL
jgi:hypothetical protein